MLQKPIMDVAYVASLYFTCFMCFRRLFQMFHLDVSKVDLGLAHIAAATDACFKHMFQVFHLFQTYVVNISSKCFKSTSRCCMAPMASGQWPTAVVGV